jgi:SOS-response transcriptional repressor LexA
MGWADHAKKELAAGRSVVIRPRGHSMKGKVNDGDMVTVEPVEPDQLGVGDIVLVRCKGTDYLHLVKAIDGSRFQIGNNRGRINGWVGSNAIYGKATKVES